MHVEAFINRKYSKFLFDRPWTIIFVVSCISIGYTAFGIILKDFPDFTDPAKGFYARGKDTITGRLLILQKIVEKMAATSILKFQAPVIGNNTCDVPEEDAKHNDCAIEVPDVFSDVVWPTLNINESGYCFIKNGDLSRILKIEQPFRYEPSSSINICTKPEMNTQFEFYFEVLPTVREPPMSIATVASLCQWEKNLRLMFKSENSCYFSLPSIIAHLMGVPSCNSLTEAKIKEFFSYLNECKVLADLGMLRHLEMGHGNIVMEKYCRHICFRPEIEYILDFITDSQYSRSNFIQLSAIWIAHNGTVANATQDYNKFFVKDRIDWDDGKTRLIAVNMANSRIFAAMQQLKTDMYLIILAIASIVVISLFYTRSMVLCFITAFSVILSLGCAYSTYKLVYQIDLFPYINLIGAFILIGLSCDNVFVLQDIWNNELKRCVSNPERGLEKFEFINVIGATLRHATVSLFVTSCTTAAAFFTNIVNAIVYIQLFGLFLGSCILFMFLLSVTLIPATLILINKKHLIHEPNILGATHANGKGKEEDNVANNIELVNNNESKNNNSKTLNRKKTNFDWLLTGKSKIDSLINNVRVKVFDHILESLITKYRYILLVMFTVFGIVGLIAVFVYPRMKPPKNNLHRFFTSRKNLMEKFEFDIKNKIRQYNDSYTDVIKNPLLIFIWGAEGEDNAVKLHPEIPPSLNFMDAHLLSPHNLIWLDKFVYEFLNDSLLFTNQEVVQMQWELYLMAIMSSGNETKVVCRPDNSICFGSELQNKNKFNTLMLNYTEHINKYHITDVTLKLYWLYMNKEIRVFGFGVNANAAFDTFENTHKYVTAVEAKFESFKKTAPKQLQHGWFVSRSLIHYDMHRLIAHGNYQSLIAAVLIVAVALFLTTANISVTIFSMLSITFILADTIAIFVLAGWELNIMETIIIITAVGLSVDFTVHYGVAFLHTRDPSLSGNKLRRYKVVTTISKVGPAVFMAALTTFAAGFSMCPSSLRSFSQMGFFLMLIMVISWTFATFFFLPLCFLLGPTETNGVCFTDLRCVGKLFKISNSN